MNYEIRNPQATDLFVVAKIIKAVGIKNIANCFKNDEVEALKTKIAENGGVATDEEAKKAGSIIMTSIGELIFDKLDIVQDDVFKFIANLTALTVDDVMIMDIVEFAEVFMTIIKNPKFADFIEVVLKSFK